jgi:predicted  nucleic acid-binding Zn-ribbon protein
MKIDVSPFFFWIGVVVASLIALVAVLWLLKKVWNLLGKHWKIMHNVLEYAYYKNRFEEWIEMTGSLRNQKSRKFLKEIGSLKKGLKASWEVVEIKNNEIQALRKKIRKLRNDVTSKIVVIRRFKLRYYMKLEIKLEAIQKGEMTLDAYLDSVTEKIEKIRNDIEENE